MFRFMARAAVVSLAGVAVFPGSALAANVPPAQDVRQFACPPAEVQDAGFADIAGSPFALEINCLAGYGITTGVKPNAYAPAREVLRGQMAQFIARLATEHAGVQLDTSDAGFTDIAGLSPSARDAINGLANAGIVNGTTPTTYGPSGQVQRDQMASFLARLQEQVGQPFRAGEDFFADDQGNTHEGNINRIAAAGIVNGTGENAYSPASPVTRQQMAALVMRYVADRVQVGELRSAYPATEAARAVLGERTVLSASSSGKVPVRLDRPATLARFSGDDPGGVRITGEGRFVGFALVADGTDPNRIKITGGKVSTGLPADHPLGDSAVLAMSHAGGVDFAAGVWELPAGDYHLYVIADGSPVTVEMSLGGLTGTTALAPTVPVATDVARPEHRQLSRNVQSAGAPGQVHGEGLLLQLESVLSDPSFASSTQSCIYRGEEATARATYAPECPDANIRAKTLYTKPNVERSLLLGATSSTADAAETYGQGHSITNVGSTEHVDFRALWLTI